MCRLLIRQFFNPFAQFKTTTKSHENYVFLYPFSNMAISPKILRKKTLYFIPVNCMGWQVWVSTRLNEVGIESSDTKPVDGHKQPPKRSRSNGCLECLGSCHVSRMVTFTGIWSHSEDRFPAPSSKLCQIWLRHWRGTLYLRASVHRRGQRPPKGSGTNMTVEAT